MAEISVSEIMKSLKEYTKEEINNLEAFKSEIEKVPKTFCLIKLSDYEYGLSSNGKTDHRIIVKEERDKSKVREYSKNGKNYWYCSKCKSSAFLKFKYGILFAAIQHGNCCETKEYSFAKKIQSLLKQGKFNEVHGLTVNSTKGLKRHFFQFRAKEEKIKVKF
uniref:Uncharacterized protein n=1 Tax=Panagrolaimus davidi TaxID=227884 RepID=A0A914QGM3_9BILA